MIESGRKCIASKCEKCNFYRYWNMVDDKGKKEVKQICSFDILFNELPKLKGSIDGVQAASNETRNSVLEFGTKSVKTLKSVLGSSQKQIEG